jgi:tetratricopeptide (TPR) repeat protein
MTVPTQRALDDAIDRCENSGKCGAPAKEVRELLRLVRDGKVRLSEVVSKHGLALLNKHKSAMKQDELWLVHEQVATACLDTGDIDSAKELILKLDKRFPKSLRVAVLKGQLFECVEDYEKAEEIYSQILEENEAHQGAMKRRCCVAKAQGEEKKAIGLLKKYLDVFVTDAEAWEELASLYVTNQMTKQASFCYEELILIQPQNPSYHLKYADLLFGLSSSSNQQLAHQAIGYYSVVLDLTNGCSVHAMYGILACADSIKSQGRGQQQKLSEKEAKLVEKVSEKLLFLYQNKQPQLAQHVKETLLPSS